MKQVSTSSRMISFAAHLFGALKGRKKTSTRSQPRKELSTDERRNLDRKDFSYYMQIIDQDTQSLVGHLADISSGGFKLDSLSPIPPNKDYRFRMELPNEVTDKPTMVFKARSRWCEVDRLDPFVYNVGFQLTDISPGDIEIFIRMAERYGKKHEVTFLDLRRSNIW